MNKQYGQRLGREPISWALCRAAGPFYLQSMHRLALRAQIIQHSGVMCGLRVRKTQRVSVNRAAGYWDQNCDRVRCVCPPPPCVWTAVFGSSESPSASALWRSARVERMSGRESLPLSKSAGGSLRPSALAPSCGGPVLSTTHDREPDRFVYVWVWTQCVNDLCRGR